jgi:multidrug efflux system membrane fusion protein
MLASCSKGKASQGGGKELSVRVSVKTAVAKVQAVPVQLSTFGTVGTFSSIAVKTQVAGTLTKVHFEKGQLLKKGQVLYTVDARPYQATLSQAKANKVKDEVLLANYRRNLEHVVELHKNGHATSDEVDQARTTADAQVATIQADQAVIDKAQIDLDNCVITCPIDGRAGDLLVTEGNLVKANDVALVTINQIKPIQVFFSVTQADLGAVRQYMAAKTLHVETVLPSEPDRPETGELFFIDNTVDSTAGTIRLGARFVNDNERLWPGQYVLVNLRLTTRTDTIVVPTEAVSTGRDGKYVFVIGPDRTVKTRAVTPGQQVDDMIVIEKGLSAGETVVTDGQIKLKDGDKIQVQTDKPAATAPASKPATTRSTAATEAQP